MIDAASKARHSALMLMSAAVLAEVASEDLQKRALARYVFLFADAFLLWGRRWRNVLKRDPRNRERARAAKSALDSLAATLEAAGGVRDYLAAKRQAVASLRADDIHATALLWAAVNARNVSDMFAATARAHDYLAGRPREPILDVVRPGPRLLETVREALPDLEHDHWQLAGDTSADLRKFTVPVAQGGELGRLIAQINDVAIHLDVLLRIAPAVDGILPYEWLVKSALVVELNALLDLTIGPPPGYRYNVPYPLVDRCRIGRNQDAAEAVSRLRDAVGPAGWVYVRWLRNTLGAHVDDEISMLALHAHLATMDFPGVISVAEHALDYLDAVGSARIGLDGLLFGPRAVSSWAIDPAASRLRPPDENAIPGALEQLFRSIDSPFMFCAATVEASAVLAGAMSGRTPRPRTPVTVTPRYEPLLVRRTVTFRL